MCMNVYENVYEKQAPIFILLFITDILWGVPVCKKHSFYSEEKNI